MTRASLSFVPPASSVIRTVQMPSIFWPYSARSCDILSTRRPVYAQSQGTRVLRTLVRLKGPQGGRGDPRASLTMFRAAIIGVSTNQSLCEQLTHGFLDFNPGRHTRRRPARRSRLDTPRFGQVVIKLSQMFGHRVTCFTQVCRFESNPYLAPSTELRACIIGHTSMEIQ